MSQFTKKRGEVGWPNPQARQITKWAERYEIDCHEHTAQTGTIYLTLTGIDGEEITVRCADHADAHCTATYTVDPAIDQRNAVKSWIEANGDDSAFKAAAARKREYRRLTKQAGEWALMKSGEKWYPWALIKDVSDTDIARAKQQIELGYAD
jgi:hypothetical protein